MRPFDWVVVVAYIVWIVIDGLRRSKGTDKVEGYFLANRSLPWWAVGLSVMATQMSAVTLVGTTGQALRDRPALHPVLLRPAARDDHPVGDRRAVLHRAGSTPRTSISSAASTCATRSLASFLFLIGRALSLGVTLAAPAVVMSAILGWTLPVTVLVDLRADDRLHDDRRRAGGGLDRRQADVHRRRRHVGGGGDSARTASCSTSASAQALHLAGATGRLQAIDFRFDLQRDLHVLVGHDRRPVPDAVVLRLRSEPGAALPDGEVDRRGAPVAADERVRQDSAAAADPDRPACSCSSSTCSRRRRCCSTASYDAQVAASPHAARVRGARSRSSTRRSRRARDAATRDDRDGVSRQRRARAATSARRPSAIVKQATGDAALQRRQLRVPDLHHDADADRPGRA